MSTLHAPSLWCPRLGFCPKTQVYKVVLLSEHYGVEESKRVPTLVYTLGVKGNNVWKRVNVGDDVHGETTDCFSQWNYSLGCDIPFCTTIYIYIFIWRWGWVFSIGSTASWDWVTWAMTKLGISLGVLESCLECHGLRHTTLSLLW